MDRKRYKREAVACLEAVPCWKRYKVRSTGRTANNSPCNPPLQTTPYISIKTGRQMYANWKMSHICRSQYTLHLHKNAQNIQESEYYELTKYATLCKGKKCVRHEVPHDKQIGCKGRFRYIICESKVILLLEGCIISRNVSGVCNNLTDRGNITTKMASGSPTQHHHWVSGLDMQLMLKAD